MKQEQTTTIQGVIIRRIIKLEKAVTVLYHLAAVFAMLIAILSVILVLSL